ncbi:PRC-barrel domain-containing protein [Oceanicola sp. S124]|uniref:PRC-barrel domain-containing protein n=1 Tax=Oceanicola sp. S124 TaxID=1042378 RepID=UPI0002559C69|nr:PRC-barrel domain-containing protein [Oceanicola sp. S124]
MTSIKTLMTTAAALAIAATPVLADVSSNTSADGQVMIDQSGAGAQAEADTSTGIDLDNDGQTIGEEIAEGVDATGDYISDTANDVAENVEEGVDAMTPSTFTAGTLVGYEVAAEDGEVIGEIDNVVLVNGTEMAVVGIGGFLGLGEHDVALPLTDLATDASDETKLKASGYTKAQLEAMAEFDPEAAEEVGDDEPVMLGAS